MQFAHIFIRRPIGTSLVAIGLVIVGTVAYEQNSVALLPAVDLPTISVSVSLPGASPKTVATSVAAPLERQLGLIAGVTDLTSFSGFGFTSVVAQFALGRDIDAAAHDVQAAINAAASELPADLPAPPTVEKSNPAMAPLLDLALTSDTLSPEAVFDFAQGVVAQRLSQIEGVAGVSVDGAEKSAIRVAVDPAGLASTGLGLEDIRAAIVEATIDMPTGSIDGRTRAATIATNLPRLDEDSYRSLVITYQNDAPLRLRDVATVTSTAARTRLSGWFNDRRAVFVTVLRTPGANLVDTVERARAALRQIQRWMPAGVRVAIVADRSASVRTAITHFQTTLAITIALVAAVIFIFLRRLGLALIPSATIPVSIAGASALMYLLDYSIDILSLMALTIAVGFVVDDAIVMLENIGRYRSTGWSAIDAAFLGAGQISRTIVSITAALIAASIPLLFMPEVFGRFMREFAVTLCAAIVVSAIASLTLIPALCALVPSAERGWAAPRIEDSYFAPLLTRYERSLRSVLRHRRLMLVLALLTCAASVLLLVLMPTDLMPPQDVGVIVGSVEGTQDSSAVRERHLREVSRLILSDPAVTSVAGAVTEWGNWMYVNLKPLAQRKVAASAVIDRLQVRIARLPGLTVYMQPLQDFWIAGRQGYAQYQYTLQGEDWDEVAGWTPIVRDRLRRLSALRDVETYQEDRAVEAELKIDRDRAAQLGVSPKIVEDTLYDAFGERQVATIYNAFDQTPIVLTVKANRHDLDALKSIYVPSAAGDQVPLSAIARPSFDSAPAAISHRGQLPYVTLAFNVAAGTSLSRAVKDIRAAEAELRLPAGLHSSFEGNAREFESLTATEPLLIVTAVLAIYIVLGVLYESYIHPLTVLSTLPSACLGALLALLAWQLDLSVVAFIGIILVIGIVAKNAIMLIDFALDAERGGGLSPEEAILRACRLRLRPIAMTTLTAAVGSLPLVFSAGLGSELWQPLGVTVVGGLLVSQLLTLYTTPVIYLYLSRLSTRRA